MINSKQGGPNPTSKVEIKVNGLYGPHKMMVFLNSLAPVNQIDPALSLGVMHVKGLK